MYKEKIVQKVMPAAIEADCSIKNRFAIKQTKFNLFFAKMFLPLIALLVIVSVAKGNCPVNRGNGTWYPGGKVRVPLENGCWYEVEFCYREPFIHTGNTPGHNNPNPETHYDVWLGAVTWCKDCDCEEDIEQFDNDPLEFMRRALDMIIMNPNFNPWGERFSMDMPPCSDIKLGVGPVFCRMGVSSCYSIAWDWQWRPDAMDPQLGQWVWLKLPCNPPETPGGICWEEYQICWKINDKGERYMDKAFIRQHSGEINCGTGCIYICR